MVLFAVSVSTVRSYSFINCCFNPMISISYILRSMLFLKPVTTVIKYSNVFISGDRFHVN